MKTLNILLVILTGCAAHAIAQHGFCAVSLEKVRNRNLVNFSVPKEVNVLKYRIEAGNDSTEFTVIGSVKATGNSVFAKDYFFEVFDAGYKYYRVAIDRMGAGLQYSKVIAVKEAKSVPALDPTRIISCSATADNR